MLDVPLGSLRVLELGQFLAGPYCGQLLADMGADVVKVEPPGRGEQGRTMMGQTVAGPDTAFFIAVNRNKRSVTVDLKSPEGKEVFHRLVATADVLVENFRPGVTARLGIDYESLREVNPALVYASISGFGQTGPYRDLRAHDLIAQGMSGMMSVTGDPDGPPEKAGLSIADLSAGLFGAFGVLTAYVSRLRTGRGQAVDTSIFEGPLALSVFETAQLWALGELPRPVGSTNRSSAPNQAFRARDGHLNICATNEKLWAQLCQAIDRLDLTDDARFTTNADRLQNQTALAVELEATLRKRDKTEWVEIIRNAGVPAGPIYDYQEVFEDPHTQAREMVVEMDHPLEGRVRGLGIPVKLSETPGRIRRPAPLLGQHTDETLTELGYSADEIRTLRGNGVV
ncbi:CoA-transferase [Pseudonocardia sp. CNS-139]|nr:CoA-transferase [Pseudonocardia sp. CNS-139]